MRILLVAEGKHEFHGALEHLVRRLLPPGTVLSHVEKRKMSDPEIGHVIGKGQKLTKRILSAMRKACQLECDALVLLIDEDGYHERRDYVNDAQKSMIFPIPRAIGVAIQTFDAWMLADETAISRALAATIQCQANPETLPNPKRTFEQLRAASGSTIPIHQAYALVAQHSRIDILVNRCGNGFAPFAERVRQLRD